MFTPDDFEEVPMLERPSKEEISVPKELMKDIEQKALNLIEGIIDLPRPKFMMMIESNSPIPLHNSVIVLKEDSQSYYGCGIFGFRKSAIEKIPKTNLRELNKKELEEVRMGYLIPFLGLVRYKLLPTGELKNPEQIERVKEVLSKHYDNSVLFSKTI
jgi:hypothetical protein